MATRTGVFFCRCSGIISDRIDESRVLESARSLPDVVAVDSHNLACSPDGKNWLEQKIKEHDLDSVVVVACSPKLHEKTFMDVLEKAGLNPFMVQMANVREQVAWITPDRERATEKAIAYTRAAIRRVQLHEPLETKQISCNTDVLVIGGGVAGLETAQNLSRAGRKIFIVEKEPYIGGRVARFEEVFPSMECAPCMIAAKLQEVLQDPNITVMTNSEVVEVKGFLGNFEVKIMKKASSIDPISCLGCGECYPVCTVEVDNKFDENLGKRKAIYVPFPGALPNVPVIDRDICLHYNGGDCRACADACPLMAVDFDQQDETIDLFVGGIVVAIGGELIDAREIKELGFGDIPDVLTSMQFERLNASNGPTGGQIIKKNGEQPKSIALVHCVGSRTDEHKNYCSSICCLYTMKFIHHLKHKIPGIKIVDYYRDLCFPGKRSQIFADNELKGVEAIRFSGKISLSRDGDSIKITVKPKRGRSSEKSFDMVILAPAMVPPRDANKIAELLDINLDEHGFFAEDHPKMNIYTSSVDGIGIAGTAQSPKSVEDAMMQGTAVAGRLLSQLVPGRMLEVETKTAYIDEELCSGCKMCIAMCPYSAISYNIEKKISEVNEVLCKGCGTCVATCPSGSAKARHFTREQISAELEEVIR